MFVRTTIAALALIGAAAPVLAQVEPMSIKIKVSDLDLSRPADRDRFDIRVKSAARSTCHSGLGGTEARVFEQRCIDDVVSQAEAQIEE